MRVSSSTLRGVAVCGVCATAVLLAPAESRADVFLLKSGARVHGDLDAEYTDDHKVKWMRVKTPFGSVRIRSKSLKKRLRSRRKDDTLRVREIVVSTWKGRVEKSDDGLAWTRLLDRSASGTSDFDQRTAPSNTPNSIVAPGERIRTGDDGEIDLDVGYGMVHVRPQSEVCFVTEEATTLQIHRGAAGLRLDDLPEKERFRVETPQASMGVRGTTFVVRAGDTTILTVADGVVAVGDTLVESGESVEVSGGGDVSPRDTDGEDDAILERLGDAFSIPRIDWVYVPTGKFRARALGSQGTSQAVTVSVSEFEMSRCEITNAQYAVYLAFIARHDDHRWCHPDEPGKAKHPRWISTMALGLRETPESMRGDLQPVSAVDWHSAYGFCRWIGARLPSEGEWEYAAKAGLKKVPDAWTPDSTFDEYEWSLSNCGDAPLDLTRPPPDVEPGGTAYYDWRLGEITRLDMRAHDVGTRLPNRFGLHDMLGNVCEWMADIARRPGSGQRTEDGTMWVGEEGVLLVNGRPGRVTRGSSWMGVPRIAQAYETSNVGDPEICYVQTGFRPVRSLAE